MAQRELHARIEVGEEIITAGGIFGHVREAHDEDELLVEVPPNVRLRVARRAVAAVIPPENEAAAEGVLDGEPIDDDAAAGPDAEGRDRG